MPLWDRLRGLELVADEFRTERQSVDVSTQFTRVTTTVVLRGSGHEGRGEDVTYTAEDHDWFPELEPPGATTLADFSADLDKLALIRIGGSASLLVLFLLPPAPVIVVMAIVFWLSISFGGPFHLRLWGAMYPARLRGRVVGVTVLNLLQHRLCYIGRADHRCMLF